MIQFLLQEIEKSPNPLFTKKELLSISPDDFQELTKKKILVYFRPADGDVENIRLPRCQHGCPLTVVRVEGGLEAVCLEHPEEDPIPLEKDDLNRYAFSLDALLSHIRTVNRIEGKLHRISGGYFYVGYKNYGDNRVGFIFTFGVGSGTLVTLPGLKRLCSEDDILVVLTPASKIEDVPLKRTLHHDKIVQTSLTSSLNPQSFELPIEKLLSGLVRPRALVELSRQQKADYKKHEYRCYDSIHIAGDIPMRGSNLVEVNGHKMRIPDYLFVLLMRFAEELMKKKGGWVSRYTLGGTEHIVSDGDRFQPYSNLRTAIEGSLLDKDGSKFVECDGSKNYRISTHPDFITYDKENLRNHPEHRVREIAKRLPPSPKAKSA